MDSDKMRTLKFQGSTIRVMVKDLKSAKHLVAKNAEISYPQEQMGKYIGKIQKGLPHGYGVKTWPDGKKYQGQWLVGKMHGKGELIIGEKESFIGEFVNGIP